MHFLAPFHNSSKTSKCSIFGKQMPLKMKTIPPLSFPFYILQLTACSPGMISKTMHAFQREGEWPTVLALQSRRMTSLGKWTLMGGAEAVVTSTYQRDQMFVSSYLRPPTQPGRLPSIGFMSNTILGTRDRMRSKQCTSYANKGSGPCLTNSNRLV